MKAYTFDIEVTPKITHKNIGNTFDSFLDDEGIRVEVEDVAIRNVKRYFKTDSCGFEMKDFHCGMPDLEYDSAVPSDFGIKSISSGNETDFVTKFEEE